MKKVFLIILFILIGVGGYYYYNFRGSSVYISSSELSHFSRLVPGIPESCAHVDAIEYYYYEDISLQEAKNNKFGLYIYPDNEQFIELADELVNSNDGDWGYVLLPYNVQERDREKWERVFYLLNKKHLIPIVQLWNVDPTKHKEQTIKAAEFLNSFIWPIKPRYISVYNEPNDAKFWDGTVDPEKYANVLSYTIDKFKEENEDFFIMNGGLNVSASTTNTSLDSFDFMWRMNQESPGIFERLDGWASHSYPQPTFSGSPYSSGRWSIRAYEDELAYLKSSFGVADLPVFITETGWAHSAGSSYDNQYISLDKVAENLKIAYEEVWLPDDRVRAVMPFTVWYEPPFDHFSWVDSRWVPYAQFQTIKHMKKVDANPPKLSIAEISSLGCEE